METLKNYFNFFLCIMVAVLLAYLISGSGGIFIIMLLCLANLFSIAMLVISVKSVTVGLDMIGGVINKGDDFTVQLRLGKKSILPSSFIEVTIKVTPNISGEREELKYRFICSGIHGDTIDIPLKAVLCGGGEITVEKIVLSDYLGLLTYKLKELPERRIVKILPRIPDTGSQTEVLRSVSQNISFDDSDEESDETSAALTGVPGYEHREYIPGDPLKRVNWKLSSKKEQLMVRLDEKVTSSSHIFMLDLPRAEMPDYVSYSMMDVIIEGSLAMLSMMIRSGYESEYNYFIDGKWEMAQISDEGSLVRLQERLSGIIPYPSEDRKPDHNINEKGKAMMCFTACMGSMVSELAELANSFAGTLVVAKESGIGAVRADMWSVSSEFEFTKLS